MSRRRFINSIKKPLLVKLTSSPGTTLSYTFLSGYKYVDLLVVGGGGAGGTNSGGGGASGTILYVKNFILSNLGNKTITYNIAKSSPSTGNSTILTLDNTTITVTGGGQGGANAGNGGNGGNLNTTSIVNALTQYVTNPSIEIAMANNGGGGSGNWNNPAIQGYPGASGASMYSSGLPGGSSLGGSYVSNTDGTGGYSGGSGYGKSNNAGVGNRRNSIIIPIKSLFEGGGQSGAGSGNSGSNGAGGGGGAAGYQSGGNAGSSPGVAGSTGNYGAGGGGGHGSGGSGANGGQGIICLYYHN